MRAWWYLEKSFLSRHKPHSIWYCGHFTMGMLMGLTPLSLNNFGLIMVQHFVYSGVNVFDGCYGESFQNSVLSPKYLVIGGALFVSYEICLALALLVWQMTDIKRCKWLVVNYLWPAFNFVLLTVLISRKPVNTFWFIKYCFKAFIGVAWTITGDDGLSVSAIALTLRLTHYLLHGIYWRNNLGGLL